jgi:hypothetical protein
MVQPGTGRHNEERKRMTRNLKGKTPGRQKGLENFLLQSNRTKRKECWKTENEKNTEHNKQRIR